MPTPTGTQDEFRHVRPAAGRLGYIFLDWTSDGSGNVETDFIQNLTMREIKALETIPDGAGDAPDTYTVKLRDDFEDDVLSSIAARHISNTEWAIEGALATPFRFVHGQAYITIAGAGANNKGRLRIFYR